MQQKISLPLDPRRGGSILLPEEAVQLAKSEAPVVGPSIASLGGSVLSKYAQAYEKVPKGNGTESPQWWIDYYHHHQKMHFPLAIDLLKWLQKRLDYKKNLYAGYLETLEAIQAGKKVTGMSTAYYQDRLKFLSAQISNLEQAIALTNEPTVEPPEVVDESTF